MQFGSSRSWWVGVAALGIVSLALAEPSPGVTIDFEGLPDGPFASYVESGVTFTSVGGGDQLRGNFFCPNFTRCLIDDHEIRRELRADIAGGATRVSVDLGDGGFDAETLFLEVYASDDTLLGDVTLAVGVEEGLFTLTVSQPGIAYAIFGARGGERGSSVYADNFDFTPVPEPGSLALLALGLAGIGAGRRTF